MKEFSEHAAPGAEIADTFPPLGGLPLALQWWRKRLQPKQQRQTNVWMKFWNNLKVQMDTKQAPTCFVKQMIEEDYPKLGITEVQAAYLAGSEFGAHVCCLDRY